MRKSHLLLLILLFNLFYLFSGNSFLEKSSNPVNLKLNPSTTGGDKFILGALNNYSIDTTISKGMLKFNLWHTYTDVDTSLEDRAWRVPDGWKGYVEGDSLFADKSVYTSGIGSILNDIGLKKMSALMIRPKIEWLVSGQRSDYQCETVSPSDPLYFYGFNFHGVGSDYTESSGEKVWHCEVNPSLSAESNAGWVVKSLRANTEQCMPQGDYKSDEQTTWHVKPKIRIEASVANGTSNPIVCRIDIINGNGFLKDTIYIRAKNFVNGAPYDGSYLEEFNFSGGNRLTFKNRLGDNSFCQARGLRLTDDDNAKADYQVYWYGNCDMWIDYIRVDNQIANDLLGTGAIHNLYMNWLEWEAKDVLSYSAAASEAAYRYYTELYEYNNIPCMNYVSRKLDSIAMTNPNPKHISLMAISVPIIYAKHVPWVERNKVFNDELYKTQFIQKMGLDEFLLGCYPFTSSYHYPEPSPYPTWSRIPSTLPDLTGYNGSGKGLLSVPVSPDEYDRWLQATLDSVPYSFEAAYTGTTTRNPAFEDPGAFRYQLQLGDRLSKETGKKFLFNPQVHLWFNTGFNAIMNNSGATVTDESQAEQTEGEVLREPTNEELDLMMNLAISYGVKGLIYFEYTSRVTNPGAANYSRGVVEYNETPRYQNIYGQPKFGKLKSISERIRKWEPYIMSFDNTHRHSYIYHSEKDSITNNTFINDIITSKTSDISQTLSDESSANRYVQAAVFKNDSANKEYFMIINKRCSPISDDFPDGKRKIKIKFNANNSYGLNNFDNWKILDVENGAEIATFDKNSDSYVDLGWFDPGQGKLFRVLPVMITGGTLVGNENISSVVFDCNGSVTANVNKNITIGENVTINFKDSVGIFMTGGNFKCGTTVSDYLAPNKTVKFYSQGGMQWAGLNFIGLDTIIIQNTELKNIKSIPDLNEGYGIDLLNTKYINVDGIRFDNTNSSAAGVHINYVTNLYMDPEINITNNIIKISTDGGDGIYIHPYSWLTLTPYIYQNYIINTSSGGGEFGIFGFDLEGTAVKDNIIENFQNGILTWYSSLDLYKNTIDTKNISNGWDLYGIVSEYNLSNAYDSRLGGSNVLTTYNGKNICLDALDINLTDGNNIFNVNDTVYSYHLAGYYPTSGLDKQNAYNNCFRILGNPVGNDYEVRKNVTESDGRTQVTFDFGSFNCPSGPNYCNFYIGGTPTDTVWIECAGGMSGGQKEISDSRRASAPQTLTYKQIYDSLSINMRKRQYEIAAEKCIVLLDNYSDSAKVINCVDKFYRTALAGNKVSELKSYFESFIQNHPNNERVISRMFYYIQKAKARLGQYQSALQGFQTIMNQFPTSFEGLAARWDYMATQLLDSLHGEGGGEKEILNNEQLTEEQQHERLVNLVEDPLDKYDKKKFTKEDRKVIVNNIVNAFENQKTKETQKLKELEVKVIKNEASESERKEYKKKSILKDVVKPQKVHSISEHLNVVQKDIKRVFPTPENKGNKDNINVTVPLEYKLNQNYPNPFNPTTKINYELKNAGFVSLKIYDLLGREIAELVNETKDAGRYTVDFNASKYMMASGIYFYRIKAGDFVDTKRMVLIK